MPFHAELFGIRNRGPRNSRILEGFLARHEAILPLSSAVILDPIRFRIRTYIREPCDSSPRR